MQDLILHELGFTWGNVQCYLYIVSYAFVCLMLGWILMVILARRKS